MKKFLDLILIKEIVGPILIVLVSILLYLIVKNVINSLINNLVKYFIIIIDVVMILDIFGIDTKTLIASLGVVGIVAGLAVQDTLKDFVAGMTIILENQYRVVDTVTIKGFRGEVIDLGIKSTKIRSLTGEVMIVPNHLIEEVINHSLEKSVAIVDIPLSYDTNPMEHLQVERDLKKIIKQCLDKNHIVIPFPQVVIHNG